MDRITAQQRHFTMSRIRGKDTKPEMLVRSYLFSQGFRFRKNDKRYPGHPDIVLPKYRTMVFVNGCFWHGHEGCRYYVVPKSNTAFWQEKIARNRARDLSDFEALTMKGWNVITIWECQLDKAERDKTMSLLVSELHARGLALSGAKEGQDD